MLLLRNVLAASNHVLKITSLYGLQIAATRCELHSNLVFLMLLRVEQQKSEQFPFNKT